MATTTIDRPTETRLTPTARPVPRAHPEPKERITFAEYIERERASEERHDFVDGVMVPVGGQLENEDMAGASYEHVVITKNLTVLLENALDETPCQPLGSDMRLEVVSKRRYYYPDVIVLCGEPRITPDECLQNPVLIAEVLSGTTAATDRGDKFRNYRMIDTLKHYALIDQYAPRVEHYERLDTGVWALVGEYESLADVWKVRIENVEVALPLARIYRRLSFAGTDPEDE